LNLKYIKPLSFVDLVMRKYFIDYFQFWLPIKREDVYEELVKKDIKENITKNLFSKKIEKRLIDNTSLSLNDFFKMYFNHGGLIFHIPGKYFDTDGFSNNVNQIFQLLNTIYADHKDHFDFEKATNTRMDIACNLPMYLNTHRYVVKKSKKIKNEHLWYLGKEKQNNVTGLSIGKRGKSGLQLSIYDKRYSPNKEKDHRFNYKNFSRLEYKIGRNYLKNKLNLGIPKSFRKYQEFYPIDIIRYISKYRSITFIEEKNYSDYYTDNDYNTLMGIDVDDPSAEPIKVKI
jgi:hypothetical protein